MRSFRNRSPLQILSLSFTLMVALALLAGCGLYGGLPASGPEAHTVGPGELTVPADAPTSASIYQVSLADFNTTELQPAWQKEFTDGVSVSVSPSGSYIAAFSYFGWGDWERIGVNVYDKAGGIVTDRIRWYKSTYRNGWVKWGSEDDALMLYMNNYQTDGRLYVYTANGKLQWSYFVDGSASAHMTAEGSRTALLNDTRGRLHILDSDGQRLALHYVEKGSSAQWSDNGERLLVMGEKQAIVFDRSGEKLLTAPLPEAEWLSLRLSPDGRLAAATTGSSDSRLYLFDLSSGDLASSHMLLPGGGNSVRFADGNEFLMVYDVGSSAGLALYALAEEPGLLWRRNVIPTAPGRVQETKAVWLALEDNRILAHYTESFSEDGEYMEDSWLLVFSAEGEPLSQMYLGQNVDLSVSADLAILATVTNNAIDRIGYVNNQLSTYLLDDILSTDTPD